MVPRQGTVSAEPTGGVTGAGADALIHSSALLDLQRNFAVIARCFSLLFPGGDRQESRISAVKGRCLAVIFRIISGISGGPWLTQEQDASARSSTQARHRPLVKI
jgi:hypothetical protein